MEDIYYQYCVMYPRVSETEPHRGPYDTYEEAFMWIMEAEDDGFKHDAFEVWERPIGDWRKSSG